MSGAEVAREALLELAKARGLSLAEDEVSALQAALAEQRRAVSRLESVTRDTMLEPVTGFDARWPEEHGAGPGRRRGQVSSGQIPVALYPTYSQGVTVPCAASTLLFIAGQVAPVAEEETPNEFRRQVTCCYEQMRTIIEAANGELGELVQTTAYLTDIANLPELASVRADFVGHTPPASTVVEVAALARPDLLVEIDGIAVLSQA